MQLSTSTVLAAVALLAGQAYSKCGTDSLAPQPSVKIIQDCTPAAGARSRDNLRCGASNAIFEPLRDGSGYQITATTALITVRVVCEDGSNRSSLTCEPGSVGKLPITCKSGIKVISYQYGPL
ncbi:hypothetical protein E4U53_003706 [Claviceps sorghi]|nr:hypothetical protein E4U53_003706 [Claviceps sorghi]